MGKNRVYKFQDNNLKLRKAVYLLFGILEALLAFRFIFKILGANPKSSFVFTIYNISAAFLAPFSDIFRAAVSQGIEVKSVLEPATMIAMIVYGFVAYGLVRLIRIYGAPKNNETE